MEVKIYKSDSSSRDWQEGSLRKNPIIHPNESQTAVQVHFTDCPYGLCHFPVGHCLAQSQIKRIMVRRRSMNRRWSCHV
jgi:hypothetical protein